MSEVGTVRLDVLRVLESHAHKFMMHLQDVDAWDAHVVATGVVERYGVKVGPIESQPWRMRDFTLCDPSGVPWRIAQRVH